MAQKQPDKKNKGVMILVTLPFRLNRKLVAFTAANHLRTKSIAIVKILETRLLPVVDGHVS